MHAEVDGKVETQGLADNSPLHNFCNACTQGLLSMQMDVLVLACMMYGLNCSVVTMIAIVSI